MIDVSAKQIVQRRAVAEGFIRLPEAVLRAIRDKKVPKGDVLEVARVAGLSAAKLTPQLLPMCHPLALTHAAVRLVPEERGLRVTAEVKADERTGVEMEALTAVAAACLCVWDLCKGIDASMTIESVRLLEKTKIPR